MGNSFIMLCALDGCRGRGLMDCLFFLLAFMIGILAGYVIALLIYANRFAEDRFIDIVGEEYEKKLNHSLYVCSNCGSTMFYKDAVWEDDSPLCHSCYAKVGYRG